MNNIQKVLWVLLTMRYLVTCFGLEVPCELETIKLTVNSYRNQTGQWVSEIGLKQEMSGRWTSQQNETSGFELEQTSSSCNEGLSYLDTTIRISAIPIKNSSKMVPKEVPKDYEFFPGVGYYKFHPEALIWPLARRACAAEGGHLIILNSEEENSVAVRIIARHPSAGTWFMTGIQEEGIHKQYFTIFGIPIEKSGFYRFYPGQEDARGPADYGGMHRTGGYSDVNISEKYGFICEYDLV